MPEMTKPELLAPAGSIEAVRAAILAGADAVYLGSAAFGARSAVGFDRGSLKEAIDLIHLYGRSVYVTVNTLVRDSEFPQLRQTLDMLASYHADAVLVQDLGVARLIMTEYPGLTIHASTQMTIYDAAGAKWLLANGVKRAVLAREATKQTIESAVRTGIEVEVFAHGALCVSVSGQCLLSSALGPRSGNRGRCAQPCRLNYRYRDQEAAWLSPADLCTLRTLHELASLGVRSFKLEGRLKRPEYVSVVTGIYRRAIDSLPDPLPEDELKKAEEELRQIFSRGPFTSGYSGGREDAGVLQPEGVRHTGVRLGKIDRVMKRNSLYLADMRPLYDLNDGDGLSVGDDQVIYSGKSVARGENATLRLHKSVAPGTAVYRTESQAQLESARRRYAPEAFDRLRYPMDAQLTAFPGSPAVLTLTSQGQTIRVNGPVTQAAKQKALDAELVARYIKKTDDMPFYLNELSFKGDRAFLSAGEINAMRRSGLASLKASVIRSHEALTPQRPTRPTTALAEGSAVRSGRIIVRTSDPDDLKRLDTGMVSMFMFAPADLRQPAIGRLRSMDLSPEKTVLCVPTVCPEETFDALDRLARDKGLRLAAGSVGQLGNHADFFMADEGVPVFNSNAERFLAENGLKAAMLSQELDEQSIEDMGAPTLERILTVYGRRRLMLLTHCPERVRLGLDHGKDRCTLCDMGKGSNGQCLTDRMDMRYPLSPIRLPDGCRIELLSGRPLSLLPYMDRLKNHPLSYALRFTDESADERSRIIGMFYDALSGKRQGAHLPGDTCHFLDPVL